MMLKSYDNFYFSFHGIKSFIKLKKDYIAGRGDTADFAIISGRRDTRYIFYSSNLRAHGVCDYGTLPIMRQDLSSYLTTYIYKYTRPFRMVFFCLVTVKLSNCLLRSRDSQY